MFTTWAQVPVSAWRMVYVALPDTLRGLPADGVLDACFAMGWFDRVK